MIRSQLAGKPSCSLEQVRVFVCTWLSIWYVALLSIIEMLCDVFFFCNNWFACVRLQRLWLKLRVRRMAGRSLKKRTEEQVWRCESSDKGVAWQIDTWSVSIFDSSDRADFVKNSAFSVK